MKSPSGKVEWLCPACRSPNIIGPLHIMGQKSMACGHCLTWRHWAARVKLSEKLPRKVS